MKLRRSNCFLSAVLSVTGFALTMCFSQAAIATKTGKNTDLADAASWTGVSGPGFPISADTATWISTSLGAGGTLGSVSNWGSVSVAGALSDIDFTRPDLSPLRPQHLPLQAGSTNSLSH